MAHQSLQRDGGANAPPPLKAGVKLAFQNNHMHIYENILSASKGLLLDAINVLSESNVTFVVVGGWCPYLRNALPIRHPGTKDVDILFSDGNIKGALNDAVELFLNHGYLVSAKHDFQLLKQLKVGNREFVFNIDLLHPSETINNPELTIDHFDLGVTESDLPGEKHVRSIVLPSSQLIFDGFYSIFPVQHTLPSGVHSQLDIPLIDGAGLVLSKSQSVKVKKRPRDAFDIYLILRQSDEHEICEKLRNSAKQIRPIKDLLIELQEFVNESVPDGSFYNQFDLNVAKYFTFSNEAARPSDYVASRLNKILS